MAALALLPNSSIAQDQPIEVLKDINTVEESVNNTVPINFIHAGGRIFFGATTPRLGTELYAFDPTRGDAELVKDINSGVLSSIASVPNLPWASLGENVVFPARTVENGEELWISDGTAAGTTLLADIFPGEDSSRPRNLFSMGDVVYFNANHPESGTELWRTDGTSAGTLMVADIRPGSLSGGPRNFANLAGMLLFSAFDSVSGGELWRSDGTASGTSLIKDIQPGSFSSNPTNLTVHQGAVYFQALDDTHGSELWQSDGTEMGTRLVADIRVGPFGSSPRELTSVGNLLFFHARTEEAGTELWASGGTQASTRLVKDIREGPGSGLQAFAGANLTAVGDSLFFSANEGASGTELWVSDGTEIGTRLVVDFSPSPNQSSIRLGAPFKDLGGTLLYATTAPTTGNELYRSDGTAAGTALVRDIGPGTLSGSPSRFFTSGDKLYFGACDDVLFSVLCLSEDAWVSDGTPDGTEKIPVFNRLNPSSEAEGYAIFRGRLIFSSDDGLHGKELWTSDGTVAGTYLLRDINPGTGGSFPSGFTKFGEALFFAADDGNSGVELWITDGTATGTTRVADISPGEGDSSPRSMVAAESGIYFVAEDPFNGAELWRSDGSTAGTNLVKDIRPGDLGSSPRDLIMYGDVLLFSATGLNSGRELWRSDGTPDGTYLVKDIIPGIRGSGSPSELTRLGEHVYFVALDEGSFRQQLWKTDGSEDGTVLVRGAAMDEGGDPGNLFALGSTLFYSAVDIGGRELWKTDGTMEGTLRVADIRPGGSSSEPQDFVAFRDKVFFTAVGANGQRELWASDGTAQGTSLIADIDPFFSGFGINPDFLPEFTVAGGELYFKAGTREQGFELWKTDGRADGTRLVADLEPGLSDSLPGDFTLFRGKLIFSAYDGTIGREPRMLTLNRPPARP